MGVYLHYSKSYKEFLENWKQVGVDWQKEAKTKTKNHNARHRCKAELKAELNSDEQLPVGRCPGAKFRKLKYSIYNSDPPPHSSPLPTPAKNWDCALEKVNILLGRVPQVGLEAWARSRAELKITRGTHNTQGAGEGSLSLL